MFKINRKIEYALIALKHMSTKIPGQLTSAKEICENYGTPFDPTSRVLQIMAQNEILQAEQGAHGGYQIIKNLSRLTMKDLSQLIAGPIEIANCFHDDYSCCEISHSCHIIAPMLNLNENINKLFSTIVISDLLESKHHGEKDIRLKKIAETKSSAIKKV
ncbi:MAG: Rrf2 family transcriptional regulator [Candidatus Omnitrophica bacterium]|nr:Rrf2 family transcriptional regulator [Candidatus Omnitrophota bacterium]